MAYKYDERPNTQLTEQAQSALKMIKESDYSVLVGRNNCGKSYLLKLLTQQFGQEASYLGPARYNNFNVLGYYTPNSRKKEDKWRQFLQQVQREQQNFDNSPVNLQQAIAELPDEQRDKLIEIIERLLGVRLTILRTVETNSMSQNYISCNGHNISYTSSGFRLIATLVTSLLDLDYDTFLIDEPELGISPEAQGVFADFIFNRDYREKYFPHIKHLVFATHSTIFLDRKVITNNYTMSKKGDVIDIEQIKTVSDFNNAHFFLLGNRLENLYLPTCLVLTEGKCDHAYISRILKIKFPTLQISVINSNSDSRMKEYVHMTGHIFTDLQKSPYRNRILAVLDKVHGGDIVTTLGEAGIPKENILIWSKNGIEHYYPDDILNRIFGGEGELTVKDDIVTRNGVSYKKWELCEKVLSMIDNETKLPDEVNSLLFDTISKISE